MDEELIIAKDEEAAVRMARELSENCPPNYFIVEDHNSNTAYYKHADPPHNIIKTRYTVSRLGTQYEFVAHKVNPRICHLFLKARTAAGPDVCS